MIVRSCRRAAARLRAPSPAPAPRSPRPRASGTVSDQPAAQALLTVLAATANGLNGEQAVALVTRADRPGGPGVGAAAPPSLRRETPVVRRARIR